MKYLRVRNWERFQYRSDKPLPWIRNYNALLENYEYLSLTMFQRGILHGLWILANRTGNKISGSPAYLCHALQIETLEDDYEDEDASGTRRVRVTNASGTRRARVTLMRRVGRARDTLVTRGFLETWQPSQKQAVEVRTMDAPSAHASADKCVLDRDRDREKKETLSSTSVSTADVQTVYDHWRTARHKSDRRYDKLSDGRRTKIKARLREFPAAELIRAINAVALDPWEDRPRHDDLTVLFRSREQVERFLEFADKPASRNGHRSEEETRAEFQRVIAERRGEAPREVGVAWAKELGERYTGGVVKDMPL